jgi:hypothetical protein
MVLICLVIGRKVFSINDSTGKELDALPNTQVKSTTLAKMVAQCKAQHEHAVVLEEVSK